MTLVDGPDLAGKLTQSRPEFHHRPENGTAMAPHSSFAIFGPKRDEEAETLEQRAARIRAIQR